MLDVRSGNPTIEMGVSLLIYALATDYDDTIAYDGAVEPGTLAALRRLKSSGRLLLLVTGREVSELLIVFPEVGIFDCVVAENGAVLYDPKLQELTALASPPHASLVERLVGLNVSPLSVGHCIIATRQPHEGAVATVLRELGLHLDMQLIFNKGAIMVLPVGVNKAFGLRSAFGRLGLSEQNVVGVGDAENDHGFLAMCGRSAAVANALPSLRKAVNYTTFAERGAGVIELIEMIIETDLAALPKRNLDSLTLVKQDEEEHYPEPQIEPTDRGA